MPLLLCPNCNTSMSAVQRQGVEFDMCPSCRGVWLDRGELEKLVTGASESPRAASAPPPPPPEASYRSPPPRAYHDDDDDDDHRRYGNHKGRKKRFDLFDIFD
jgi:Zn-finger nucleic acid-binding protein